MGRAESEVAAGSCSAVASLCFSAFSVFELQEQKVPPLGL